MSIILNDFIYDINNESQRTEKINNLHDEFLRLIINSNQNDPYNLGKAIWIAKRAVRDIFASETQKMAVEDGEIYLEKINHYLNKDPLISREANKVITNLIVELESTALTDRLTGVNNRRYFDEKFEQEIDRVNRYKHETFSLIIIDIDHFKNFNDKYGHKTGDDVLKVIANLIKDNKRKSDIVCRYGGEEFCYILPETKLEGAVRLAEKLRNSIEKFPFFVEIDDDGDFTNDIVPITISLGVGEYSPHSSSDAILKKVDQALYRAKDNGRNRVEIAE